MADLELFRRALPGTRAYFPVLLITLVGMQLPWDRPALLGIFLPLWLWGGLSRYLMSHQALRHYHENPNLWRTRFRGSILLTPLVWGLFGATTIVLSGLQWDVAFCVVIAAGLGAGAAAALNPDIRLRRAYPLTLQLPMIVALLSLGRQGLGIALLSTVYMIYLIRLGEGMGRRYWSQLSDRLFVEQLSQLTLALVGNLSQGEVLTRLSDHLQCLLEFERSRAVSAEGELLMERDYAPLPGSVHSVQVAVGPITFILESGQPFDQEDRQVLQTFTHPAATALDRNRLFEEVGRLALTDELTRVANRRHFLQRANELVQTTTRLDQKSGGRTPVCVILLDVDHFKKVNDTHGHDVGDLVLREVARRCQSALREVDLLARYGGEEFSALLPGANVTEGAMVAEERLRRCVADHPFEGPQGPLVVTVSLGVAQFCGDLSETLKRADQALYQAKSEGRNCVRQG